MSDLHERLALLADDVRALPGGEEAARALIRLAADVDAHIQERLGARYDGWPETFRKWSEFMNTAIADAYRYGKDQLVTERRNFARLVASDPRWQGGYADALRLLDGGEK